MPRINHNLAVQEALDKLTGKLVKLDAMKSVRDDMVQMKEKILVNLNAYKLRAERSDGIDSAVVDLANAKMTILQQDIDQVDTVLKELEVAMEEFVSVG